MNIEHFLDKLCEIFSSVWGWISLLVMTVFTNFLSGYGLAVTFTVISVVQDLIWGIASSMKQGRFTRSELMRDTIGKLLVYGCSIICFVMVERLVGINNGITTCILCAVIILVELWSTMASMLIVFPNIPFLHIVKHALIGEIARKLGTNEELVEETLNFYSKRKNKKYEQKAD